MRHLATIALLFVGLASSSCGGGGSSSSDPPCSVPGVLRALAVQGQPAPGTAGDYGPFPAGVPMDVASGGWSVFLGTTTDPNVPSGLFVAQPDATVVLAFAHGDLVPGGQGGTISGFVARPLEITSDGRVLAEVTITGDAGGRTFGLLTATVDAGVVVEKYGVAYSGDDMSATGVAGTLEEIYEDADGNWNEPSCHLAEGGGVFFAGRTSSALDAFWRCDFDGSNRTALVAEGDALPLGNQVAALDATGIDRNGTHFAFVATTTDQSKVGLYSGTVGTVGVSELAIDGTPLAAEVGGGAILNAYAGGPLLVDAVGAVIWRATGNITSPDDLILYRVPGGGGLVLVRSGDAASGTGGGKFGPVALLNCARSCSRPMFSTTIYGGAPGLDFALYSITSPSADPTPDIGTGTFAPASAGGGTLTSTFPGLRGAGRDDVTHDGTLGFANVLSTGRSALFWYRAGCGVVVVVNGGAAPGGDTFGSFATSSTHTSADNVFLFRAPLVTAGSGIFRQGP